MLKKLWCWIWGHAEWHYTESTVPVMRVYDDHCPRCGATLI